MLLSERNQDRKGVSCDSSLTFWKRQNNGDREEVRDSGGRGMDKAVLRGHPGQDGHMNHSLSPSLGQVAAGTSPRASCGL